MYRLCTGGLLTGDLLHALLHHQTTECPSICTRHINNYVRDPTHTNTPSRALLMDLFQAPITALLHNHDGLHWGLSLLIRREHNFHIMHLESLNNRYPDLERDLRLFWARSACAAATHQYIPDQTPHIAIHTPTLPTQTINYDCGIFVLGYHRVIQTWLRTHLPSTCTPLEQRVNTLCTTLHIVTQTKMTALCQHLRNTLHHP